MHSEEEIGQRNDGLPSPQNLDKAGLVSSRFSLVILCWSQTYWRSVLHPTIESAPWWMIRPSIAFQHPAHWNCSEPERSNRRSHCSVGLVQCSFLIEEGISPDRCNPRSERESVVDLWELISSVLRDRWCPDCELANTRCIHSERRRIRCISPGHRCTPSDRRSSSPCSCRPDCHGCDDHE